MEIVSVPIDNPGELNLILGQSHFIKTVEDLYETLAAGSMGIQFGLAFCESSGPCLVRWAGNDAELVELAKKNAVALSAGHVFLIFLRNAFPIHVLNAVKAVPEVCGIYCATANPVTVILADDGLGRGVLGVIDGAKSQGVEGEADIQARRDLLRRFGSKQ
jgi:adenosine/AMP kinase